MHAADTAIIPLAYRHKLRAGIVFVCSVLFLLGLVAQTWLRFFDGVEVETDTLQTVLLVLQIILSPAWVFIALDQWHVLRGKPALWIDRGSLIFRFSGTRRIPLGQITKLEFDRFATGRDPASLTLHLGNTKPFTIWLHTLRLMPGFADTLRRATGDVGAS